MDVQHFEAACNGIQDQDKETRKQAERYLNQCRSDPAALEFSKHVLQHSAVAAAQFHASVTLREALVKTIHQLSYEARWHHINYLLLFVKDRYPRYINHDKHPALRSI